MHQGVRIGLGVCVLAAVLAARGSAAAQVCGDATGDGNVTITDGVQTLRAAASLSSSCTVAVCDVNGSGDVTITDGVNVLRKAASLPVTDACDLGGGQAAVEEVVGDIEPLLLTLGLASDANPLAAAVDTDDCPDGGSRDKEVRVDLSVEITFDACRVSDPEIGRFQIDGSVVARLVQGRVVVDVVATDLDSGREVRFASEVGGQIRGNGNVVIDGSLGFTTPAGDFFIQCDELEVTQQGALVGGAATILDTEDVVELESVEVAAAPPGNADVTATFDDGAISCFVLNLGTGALTPADCS